MANKKWRRVFTSVVAPDNQGSAVVKLVTKNEHLTFVDIKCAWKMYSILLWVSPRRIKVNNYYYKIPSSLNKNFNLINTRVNDGCVKPSNPKPPYKGVGNPFFFFGNKHLDSNRFYISSRQSLQYKLWVLNFYFFVHRGVFCYLRRTVVYKVVYTYTKIVSLGIVLV